MKYDHFSMLPERAFQPRNGRHGMTLEGGGGGGTTQSTVTQSNIPEWLRPQTEALLGAATQEYFQTTPRKTSTGQTVYDITGVKPFTPYSADPSQYFAGFTPAQEQVFRETANLQTPGAFGAAGQLMGAAGQGALESTVPAYGYGQQGQASGLYGQGIGFSYGQMATDPAAVRAYMSPYQQGVIDVAKAKAIDDARNAQLSTNLGAARQGTYGGARQAVLQGQREATLQKQLSDIQTQGLQSAYDRAVQAQQFGVQSGLQGAGLGIQGAQVGLQGLGAAQAGYGMAGQLGQGLTGLGQTQQAADLARLGFQAEIGALPQAQQQAIIDRSIQNYALQQENPYQRLSQFSGLIRGYATPTTTVEQYGGAPNTLQALGAFGTAAGGIGSLMGGKEGGVVKLAGGGGITDKDALESFAERSSIPQLQQSMRSGSLPKYIGMPILENEVAKAERMKMDQMLMAQSQQQGRPSISDEIEAKADQLQGITAVAEPVRAAGGGVVAFAGGDLVKGGLNLSPTEIKKYIDGLKKQGVDTKTINAIKRNPSLLSRVIGGMNPYALGIGAVGIPGMMATDALMSTDTGVGDEADVMFSGIEPGAGGPRTAQSAIEAGQELLGAVIPSGPGAETRAAQAEIEAQREAQGAPAVSDVYPDETQRGIVPGPTQPAKPSAGKGKPKDAISAALDGITSVGQDTGSAPQQSLKDFADQYLKDRTAYAGEDVLSKKLKERAEKESSVFDRLSSAGAQIGLAGSMLRDPSRYGEYAQQAAGLRTAEAKAKDEREMAYLQSLDRERQNKIAAFDKAEQRMSDKDKQSAQFRHEKQLNDDRLRVQAAGIKVQKLVAEATAANTRELKKASELRQYTEFFAEQPIKINRLFDDKLKALKDSNDYMTLKPEEQKQQVEAIEAARRLELDKLDKLKQDTMYGGYKIVAQR